jgi:hypothetical protein
MPQAQQVRQGAARLSFVLICIHGLLAAIYAPPGSRKQRLSAWFWSHYDGNLKSKPQLFWRRYKGKFELTYVSKSTVVVKTLSSGSRTVVSSGEQPSLKLAAAANRPHQQNRQAAPA